MSFESEFLSIYNKKKKKQKEETITKTDSFTEELLKLRQNEINEFQQKKSQNTNTESKKTSGFFKKSEAYTDFDANNASKFGITTLATAGDISARILQGFGNQFEGIADIATYLVSGAADLVGADKFAEKSKKFAQTQWVDKFANQYMKDMEAYSILGDKSDAVSQGIGQVMSMYVTAGLGTKAKLGQKAVSALTTGTNFASATGHGLTEAYNEGATDGEAWGYGLLKGGVEAGSEAVFGGLGKGANALGIGKGLSSADDMLAKALTKKITNRFLSNAGQLAVKAGGEGLEEMLAGVGTAVAKKLSYKKNNGENLWKLIEDEKLFDSFITGALTSGIAQGSGAIRATKTDTDLVSGLNRKEENVVQAVYDSRLADKQKDGKKLSALEKNKLWDDIVTEMRRGELSTDDIERVLGGDTYTEYQSRIDQVENIQKKIDALQTEHDDLNAIKNSDMTGAQQDRLAELKKELPKLKSQYKHWTSETEAQEVADLKNKLSSEVYALSKGTNLAESYHEIARRKQAFTADLSQYNEKEAVIVQKAIDSGVLNNTNHTHEFVDLVAKLAATKDLGFDFTTNKRLAESGFAIDGVTINGMVDKNTKAVTINMNSAKALETVVGHEITHILENTDLYTPLQEAVKQYATTKGEYDSRLEAITKLYANEEGADVVKELTADLVGDYIFSDADFVDSLAKGNRNLAQKILDEIKYMAKIATAGSKEKRQLEKAKKMLKDALEKSVDVKTDEDVNYSLSPAGTTESGRFMGRDLLLEDEVIEVETSKAVAPVREDIAKTAKTTDTVAEENVTTESTVSVPTVEKNTAIKDAINDLFKRYQWGDVENPHHENTEDDDSTDLVLDSAAEGIYETWDIEGSIKGNALHALLDENAEYDEYGEVSNDAHLYEIIKEKLLEVVPVYKAEAEAEAEANAIDEATNLPRWAENQIANYKETIAEERAKAKGRKKASNVSVKRYISQKPAKRNDGRPNSTTQGAKVLDGKQYMSYNGRFVLELNTPDESIPVNEQLAVDSIKGIFEKVDKDIIEGNYNIDAIDISLIRKEAPKGTSRKNLVVVGDSYFDIDYVDAVLRAIENPEISLSNFIGNDKALVIKGSNGQSIIAPVHIDSTNNLDETSFVYRAEKVGAGEITDAPIVETAPTVAKTPKPIAPIKAEKTAPTKTTPTRKVSAPVDASKVKTTPKTQRAVTVDEEASDGKMRRFVETATQSEVVDGQILPDDLVQGKIYYEPISNKEALEKANSSLNKRGYDEAIKHFDIQFDARKVTLEDIVLGERLIQESIKKGDTVTAGKLIEDVAILGTELGQKVQALSIIQRLTPEGQLRMLNRTIERAKAKLDKQFKGVEITQEMKDRILSVYDADGNYDQDALNEAMDNVIAEIADKMKTTVGDKANAWRYLSMLGNIKTHGRNMISNLANAVTIAGKDVVARIIETGVDIGAKITGKESPFEYRTKTWKNASRDVLDFAKKTVAEERAHIQGNDTSNIRKRILAKRKMFGKTFFTDLYNLNSKALTKEDWLFSKFAYKNALAEFLTANGIRTQADIDNNKKLVDKAKDYALDRARIATFQQESWLANKISEIENKNLASKIAVGAVVPFKKTPINVAKAGFNYSPLGVAKTITYDAVRLAKGEITANTYIDNLSQGLTGSALVYVGYLLASKGILNGAGDDDKEGKYDYQLGEQRYSITVGNNTYTLNWLSPTAMPLFVGANMFEQFVEKREFDGNVVLQSIAQVLDPMSDMSFLSSLNDALSSYDSGIMKFVGIFKSMSQNYITQYIPTILSQTAATIDDTKRTTKASKTSSFRIGDETMRKIMYKIPGLRNLLEPVVDIWGNEVKQDERVIVRALDNYIMPYSKKYGIATNVDTEIKELYKETGDTGLIPSVPYDNISFKGTKYNMSAKQFTRFKQNYGQTAHDLMAKLFETETYKNASLDMQADMVNRVYDYARDEAKRKYLNTQGVTYTNTTEDGKEIYRENYIKGAVDNDMTVEEYKYSVKYPEKYEFFKANGISVDDYNNADDDGKDALNWANKYPEKYMVSKAVTPDLFKYKQYTKALNNIHAGDDTKRQKLAYIDSLDIDDGAKYILRKMEFPSDDSHNKDIVNYLMSKDDIGYNDMVTILTELGMKVSASGRVSW